MRHIETKYRLYTVGKDKGHRILGGTKQKNCQSRHLNWLLKYKLGVLDEKLLRM
jgi:hypothetical protein